MQLALSRKIDQPPDSPWPITRSEKIVFWTLVLIPLWWAIGLRTLPFIFVGLLLIPLVSRKRPNLGQLAWLFYIAYVAIAGCIYLGTISIDGLGVTTYRVLAWISTAGFVLCVVRSSVLTRACALLSVAHTSIATLGLLMSFVVPPNTVMEDLTTNLSYSQPTFIQSFLPSIARGLYASSSYDGYMTFFQIPVAGKIYGLLPRLTGFYNDDPAFAIMAGICAAVSTKEKSDRLRMVAVVGGAAAVFLSSARLAPLIFLLIVGGVWLFRKGRTAEMLLGTALAAFAAFYFLSQAPARENTLEDSSAQTRLAAYDLTIKYVIASPLFGHPGISSRKEFGSTLVRAGGSSTYGEIAFRSGLLGLSLFVFALLYFLPNIARYSLYWAAGFSAACLSLVATSVFGCFSALMLLLLISVCQKEAQSTYRSFILRRG